MKQAACAKCELSTVVHFLGWMQAAVAADIVWFQPPLKSNLGIYIKTLAIYTRARIRCVVCPPTGSHIGRDYIKIV